MVWYVGYPMHRVEVRADYPALCCDCMPEAPMLLLQLWLHEYAVLSVMDLEDSNNDESLRAAAAVVTKP